MPSPNAMMRARMVSRPTTGSSIIEWSTPSSVNKSPTLLHCRSFQAVIISSTTAILGSWVTVVWSFSAASWDCAEIMVSAAMAGDRTNGDSPTKTGKNSLRKFMISSSRYCYKSDACDIRLIVSRKILGLVCAKFMPGQKREKWK